RELLGQLAGAVELAVDPAAFLDLLNDRLELGERLLCVPDRAMIGDERRVRETFLDLFVAASNVLEFFKHKQAFRCQLSAVSEYTLAVALERGERREEREDGAHGP